MNDAPYRDGTRDPQERTRDLLARMTQEEKIAQLRAIWLKPTPGGGYMVWDRMVEQGTDPHSLLAHGIGQVTRPFGTVPIEPAEGWRSLRAVQRFLRHDTRLGIPALPHDECLAGFMAQGATQFPSPLNMGATWNPALIEQVAAVIGRQMRAAGSLQGLAPVADVVRDARWGRVEECYGEDPYLVGLLATHYVRGLQAAGDLRRGVLATLKHFAGHSFGEGGRNLAPAHCGPREMNDVFLLPFEMAVRLGGCASVMSAYHDIDGEPASASHWLLTELSRVVRADHRGTIDKYIGDCVMAFWGAPVARADHAAAAVAAALDMLRVLARLEPTLALPEGARITMGVGLQTGPAVVGNMGSAYRIAYTALGDTVNTAARLEGLSKVYGAGIVAGDSVRAAVEGSAAGPQFVWRRLDLARVKGRQAPLGLHEPLCRREDADAALLEEVARHEAALTAYLERDFAAALAAWQSLQRARPAPLYALWIERATAARAAPPPPDWDGAWNHETK